MDIEEKPQSPSLQVTERPGSFNGLELIPTGGKNFSAFPANLALLSAGVLEGLAQWNVNMIWILQNLQGYK